MVEFTMSASAPSKSDSSEKTITNEEWQEWNEYLHNITTATEVSLGDNKHKKSKTEVGILNLMIEAGHIPQDDAQYDTRCALPDDEEENSPEELELIEKFPSNYFQWVDEKGKRKRKHCRPQHPEQELILCIDFPEIVVDYSKHPGSDETSPDIKPLRVSLNGKFKNTFARHIILRVDRSGKMSFKNIMYKIAEKSGKLQEFIDSKYDPGILAGTACKWTIEFNRNVSGDATYYHLSAIDPVAIEPMTFKGEKISVEDQIPKCDVPFTGIMLNGGDYSEGVLKNIRREFLNVMKTGKSFKPSPVKYPAKVLGCDWEDTDLAKALKASFESSKEEDKKDSSINEVTEETNSEVTVIDSIPEGPVSDVFDDDLPF